MQAVSSSGTTGEPMYYALTRRDLDAWMDGVANVFFTCGIRRHDVVAHLVGLPMVAGGLPYADGFRQIGATLAWLGGFPTERVLTALPRLQASAILATTSFGVHLADHCRELIGSTAADLGVKKFISGGEPGLGQPEIRAKISSAWNTSHIRECMGIGDVMSALWGECDDASGMHFCAQRHVAVELIDPVTGARVPWREGAEGEQVYTTFDREATPTLRYRSADHVVVLGTECRCGRTAPKIRCIGRTDDMLIYKGMNVYPSAIRDVVLSRFSDAVAPYMRIWKERKDQVRFELADSFGDRTPARTSGISASRHLWGHRSRNAPAAADSRRGHHCRTANHPAHRLQDRSRPGTVRLRRCGPRGPMAYLSWV